MSSISQDIMMALPELVILTMAMAILLLDLFLKPAQRMWVFVLAIATLATAAFSTVAGMSTSIVKGFHGMFVDDPLADTLKLMIYGSTIIMLIYTRRYLELRQMFRGEYYALVLFAVLGMMIMVSGQSFLTLYMGLELLSLSMYTLVALDRDNARATEAAMKYFVLGALASGMLLYGMSMLYGATGSLDITIVAQQLLAGNENRPIQVLGLVFIVSGIAFKLGAVPFQMWVPDVYHGAPTAMTLFVSSVPKLAGYALAFRLLIQGLYVLTFDWRDMLMVMAALSMVIGNVTAIAQTNIKRMLAYSTISHVGFILLGLLSYSPHQANGAISAMFYISAYVLMSLAAFGIILLLSRKGFESEQLDDLKGLNERSPWLALMMLITMFSMAGVPPTVGFYAKFSVLQAVVQAGYVWLAVFAVLMAVIGAFYYLRVVKLMYFDAPEDRTDIGSQPDIKWVISLNALALLVIGMMPQPLMAVCARAVIGSLTY